MSGNSFAAIFLFCIYCTNIGCKILSIMKIIFNYPKTSYNSVLIKTKIPTIFRFIIKVGFHAFKISFLWHLPFIMKPCGCLFF